MAEGMDYFDLTQSTPRKRKQSDSDECTDTAASRKVHRSEKSPGNVPVSSGQSIGRSVGQLVSETASSKDTVTAGEVGSAGDTDSCLLKPPARRRADEDLKTGAAHFEALCPYLHSGSF